MNEASILAEVIKATFANPSLSHELTGLLRHVLTVDIGSIKADQQRQEKELESLRKLTEEQRRSLQKLELIVHDKDRMLEQMVHKRDRERAALRDKIVILEARVGELEPDDVDDNNAPSKKIPMLAPEREVRLVLIHAGFLEDEVARALNTLLSISLLDARRIMADLPCELAVLPVEQAKRFKSVLEKKDASVRLEELE